jgi:hypothetical protein
VSEPSNDDLLATIATLTALLASARAELQRTRDALDEARGDNRALRRAVVRAMQQKETQ